MVGGEGVEWAYRGYWPVAWPGGPHNRRRKARPQEMERGEVVAQGKR